MFSGFSDLLMLFTCITFFIMHLQIPHSLFSTAFNPYTVGERSAPC